MLKKVLSLVIVLTAMTSFAMPGEGQKVGKIDMKDPKIQSVVQRLEAFVTSQKTADSRFAKATAENLYVGSEYCIACHAVDRPYMANFPGTKHMQALRRPMSMYSLIPGKGVVADYDQNGIDDFMDGLDFNTISSAFDAYKPNAPILSYEDEKYYITIGELKMQVVITQGGTGDWKQRYLLRVPVTDTDTGLSASNYVSPVQFNEKTHEYVTYHASDWYDESNQPKFDSTTTAAYLSANNSRDYSNNCIKCHTTGVKSLTEDANGEWLYKAYPASLYNADDPTILDYDHDGVMDLVNIGCEACHGPGGNHILGGGDPEEIVNPAELTVKQKNDICAQCHVRVKSVPGNLHPWPMKDDTGEFYMPGSEEPIENFLVDKAGYWGDGFNSKQHHQQVFDLDKSGKPTFQFHMISCGDCHYNHSNHDNHQIRSRISEELDDGSTLTISTENDNNTLCLACHATHGDFENITKEMVADYETNEAAIGNIVAEHSHHPYGPDRSMGLSRCSKCHMPKVAKSAISYDIHSHTFDAIAPKKTLDYNMPNTCATSCHNTKVNSFGFGLDPDNTVWNDDFDITQANKLMEYYGDGGKWWDTTEEAAKK